MLWNVVDVRDVARAHRLCIETEVGRNGSRYILSATDRNGEMFTHALAAKLQQLYPFLPHVGGEEMTADSMPKKATNNRPRAYCLLAKEELGLVPHTAEETLRATVDSYLRLGLLRVGLAKL